MTYYIVLYMTCYIRREQIIDVSDPWFTSHGI